MTATTLDSALSIFGVASLDETVACGWEETGPCSRAALWVMQHQVCCNRSKQYCSGHRQMMEERLENSPGFRCYWNLKLKNPPMPVWREL